MALKHRVTVHRDRTFEYQGVRYQITGAHASTGNSYEIVTMDFDSMVGEDWNSLREVREFLDLLAENDWPLELPKTNEQWARILIGGDDADPV